MHQEPDDTSGPSMPDVGAFLDEFLASLDSLAPDHDEPDAGQSDDLGGGGRGRS